MLADVAFSLHFFQYRPTKRKALKWFNSVLCIVKYFSQLHAGKLRSARLSRWPLSFKWEQRMNRYSESYGDSEQQWPTGHDGTSWTLPWRRFFLQNFWCSTDTNLQELYRLNDITDNKTDYSCLKALFGRLFVLWPVSCSLTSFASMELHSHLNFTCNFFLFLYVIYCMTHWWHFGLGK